MISSVKTKRIKLVLFYHMRFKFKIFFLLNILLCGIARAVILTQPLQRFSSYFGRFFKTTTISILITPQQTKTAILIGKSVRLAAKYTPWNSSCLTQAMVAKFWCAILKIPYVMYIGFAKSIDEPSGYKAHAWITAGAIAITGGNGLVDYKVVSTYISRTINVPHKRSFAC